MSFPDTTAVRDIINDGEQGIYFCTTNAFGFAGVYHSPDLGESWNMIGLQQHGAKCIAMCNDGKLYAGTILYGLYRYNKDMQEWNSIFPNTSVVNIAFNAQNHVFLACYMLPFFNGGAMVSKDNGNTFEYINEGLVYEDIDDIEIGPEGFAYACYNGSHLPGYLYKSIKTTVSLPEQPEPIEEDIVIYPNPFTTALNIKLRVNYKRAIKVELFDSDGKMVKTGKLTPNTPLKLNTRRLPPGLYFYRIKGKLSNFFSQH